MTASSPMRSTCMRWSGRKVSSERESQGSDPDQRAGIKPALPKRLVTRGPLRDLRRVQAHGFYLRGRAPAASGPETAASKLSARAVLTVLLSQ